MSANLGAPRPLALLTVATCLATVAATGTSHAQGAGRPDLAITQVESGNSQAGHTSVIVTIANHGSATASHLNVELLVTTQSGHFSDSFAGDVTCEAMPAPSPYRYAIACQLAAPLGADKSVSFSADLAGAVRTKFTSLAEVGERQSDSEPSNNSNSLSSYFGPGADLAVVGAVTTGAKAGHANAVIKIVNQGPSSASLAQAVLEAKHVGSATVTNHQESCQSIPPASGYDYAASCVVAVLDTGKAWTGDWKFVGVSGRNITVSVTASSHTADPDLTNNTLSWHSQLR